MKLRVTKRAATQIEKALDYIEAESPQGANDMRELFRLCSFCWRGTHTQGSRLTFPACGAWSSALTPI